jgi:hypothetical protein
MHIPNIHALCGIRTHDSGFRASEDSTCLRLLGYRDRLKGALLMIIIHLLKKLIVFIETEVILPSTNISSYLRHENNL